MSKKSELKNFLDSKVPDRSSAILDKLACYYNWLIAENMKVNLFSRKTDPEDLWTLHFLDSLLSIGCVDYHGKNILDVGTGGGFPGVPLAMLYPDSHFTLLDSTKKKIQSVKDGVAKAGLTNCSFLDARLEETPSRYFGTFDIVVSRSVRIVPEYKKILLKLLKKGGLIVLYKSRNLDDAALFTDVTITDVSTPVIGERKIVVVRKTGCP